VLSPFLSVIPIIWDINFMVMGSGQAALILARFGSRPDALLAASQRRETGILYVLTGETSLNS